MFSRIFMLNILEKLLKHRGIEKEEDLDVEEKADFERWRKILSKQELTIEDIGNFCKTQISIIENRWKDLSLENTKKAELIPYHTVYKIIEQTLTAPQQEREQLEATLNQLIQ